MRTLQTLILCCVSIVFANVAYAQATEEAPAEGASQEALQEENSDGHSFLVGTLLYIPNRVLDVLDIFRCRVRVGPGIAAGVRATEIAEVYAGTYASVYAGLPGPRMRSTPKLPIGLESHNGASVSVADGTIDGGIGPDYSPTEFGAGAQLGIIGIDFGFDPVEVADFLTGLFTIDLRNDDL